MYQNLKLNQPSVLINQFGGPLNRRFMVKHLKEVFLANHHSDMTLQREILYNELKSWQGDLFQTDDILVMGLRF